MNGTMCTPISSYNKSPFANVTPPKPILKKNTSNRHHQCFYGTESSAYNFGGLNIANQIRHHLNQTQLTTNQYDTNLAVSGQAKPADRFKKSAVNSPEVFIKNRLKKRTASDVYIFHSIEINREIIKSLLKSIEAFLEDFRQQFACEYFNDRDLLLTHKQKLLPKLKDFLMSSKRRNSLEHNLENGHIFEIGATLSEPNILNIKQLRAVNNRERLAHSRPSKYKLDEKIICGSLPNRFYTEYFTKEFEPTSAKATAGLNIYIQYTSSS